MVQKRMKAKTFVASSEKEAKDTIQKLKQRISKLERERRQLKSEVKSLQKALNSSMKKVRIHTDDYTLEESIESAKTKKPITDEDRKERLIKEMREKFSNKK